MVSELQQFLKENRTTEEIEEFLKNLCDKLPDTITVQVLEIAILFIVYDLHVIIVSSINVYVIHCVYSIDKYTLMCISILLSQCLVFYDCRPSGWGHIVWLVSGLSISLSLFSLCVCLPPITLQWG